MTTTTTTTGTKATAIGVKVRSWQRLRLGNGCLSCGGYGWGRMCVSALLRRVAWEVVCVVQ